MGTVVDWFNNTRFMRAFARYAIVRGGMLAGGITMYLLLALGGAMTLLINISRRALASRPDLYEKLLELINNILPGLLTLDGQEGVLDPDVLLRGSGFDWTSLIAAIVTLWSSITVVTMMRRSMRSIFGLGETPLDFWREKPRDLLGLLGLGISLLITAAASPLVLLLGTRTVQWLDVEDKISGETLNAIAISTSAVLDALIILLILTHAGIRPPWRDMLQAMALSALFFGSLRLLGTSLISASNNPLIASLATAGTLLVGINIAARAVFLIAAWTANPPPPVQEVPPEDLFAKERPNYVTLSAPHTLDWPRTPVSGALLPDDQEILPRSTRSPDFEI